MSQIHSISRTLAEQMAEDGPDASTPLEGKAILVAGGTTGIGRATASLLASLGARVFIFGRDPQVLQDALTSIQKQARSQDHVFGAIADQSKPDDIRRVFAEAEAQLGGLDILINNAALGGHSIVDTEYDEWRTVIETNLIGAIHCCQEAVNRMKPRGIGHIVNIGSLSAKVREKGSDIYVATKAGLEGFSESLRKQINEYGIKVTLIEPGLVGTDMTVDQVDKPEQRQKIAEGEMLSAEDLAKCVVYTLTQSARCDVIEIRIRPHQQAI